MAGGDIVSAKEALEQVKKSQIRDDIPDFGPGDTLEVDVRVRERQKERIQMFKGVCIGRKNSGVASSFTVRKISGGVAVERVFPLHSPNIKAVRRLQQGRVRRAKLNYLKDKYGKAARIREKRNR